METVSTEDQHIKKSLIGRNNWRKEKELIANHAMSSSNRLEKAYRPLFLWIQFLTGVAVNRCANRGKGYNFFLFMISIIIILIKFGHTIDYVSQFIQTFNDDKMKNVTLLGASSLVRTNMINKTITAFDNVYFLQTIHYSFFYVSLNRLKHLWQAMVDIEQRLGLTVHTYRMIRWIVFLGLLLVVLVFLSRDNVFHFT